MDPLLFLDEKSVSVDPGGEARVRVTIRNPAGTNVDREVTEYSLEVLGPAALWSQIVGESSDGGGRARSRVSFLPDHGDEKEVEVVFRPPAAPGAPSGEIPFGVRAQSRERKDVAAVTEGVVVVGAIHNLEPDFEPVAPRGRWTGRYQLHLLNTGTVPVHVEVSGSDTKRLLRFACAPARTTIAPGEKGIVYVAVRPKQPILRGRATQHSFTVSCHETEQDRTTPFAGAFDQLPVIASGILTAAVAVVASALAVGAFLLLTRQTPAEPSLAAPGPVVASLTTADTAELQWDQVAEADGYSVGPLTADLALPKDPKAVGADVLAMDWPGLPPGKHCFVVRAINGDGKLGSMSEVTPESCVDVGDPASGDVHGWYAVFGNFVSTDEAGLTKANSLYQSLLDVVPGVRLENSNDSEVLPEPASGGFQFVVLVDGLASQGEAQTICNEHLDLAPNCVAREAVAPTPAQ